MTEARPEASPGSASAESSTFSDVLFSFLVGFVLAILQFSYFFLLEVHLTSRSISFFVAMFFWLVGFLVGLNLRGERLFIRILVGGVVAYYVAMGLATLFPFNKYVLPALGLCIAVSGLVPGYFFPYARNRFRWIGTLFFHENNGFLLGIILSLFCAVFAGKWLLTWAPALGLLLVLALLQYQRWYPPRKHTRPDGAPFLDGQTAFPLFSVGLHLGILQAALFFIVQVYVTATYMGYFVIVLAWMLGVVINMKVALPKSLASALVLSLGAYYLMLLVAGTLAPYWLLVPLYFALPVLAAQPAGAFFRELAGRVSARSLFLHENNGFILGLLLSMFGFVKWGVHFLYVAPLLSLALALLSASAPPRRIFLFLPIGAFIFAALGNVYGFATMVVVCLVGAISCFIGLRPPKAILQNEAPFSPQSLVERALPRFLLGIAGCNLLLLQFFITREFSSVLAASELTILMVSTAYFTGISVGYAFSHCLPQPLLRFGAVLMFFLHMGILLFAKVCAGYLIAA
ncbi:MAG: hypothetical protein L3K26_04525, partial [Candidatus Hydrogenedentes bacterium]|nr:hypothetical protein [Candidatus Hydrogenedentota bacterium]